MLKATLLKDVPNFEDKKIMEDKTKIEKKEYNICKDLFSMDNINSALDSLSLKYKMLNEVDIYNIIEYVLVTNRGKDNGH